MSDAHAHAHHPIHIPVEGEFEFSNGKMAMWLLLVSDAMAFIGFLGAYMILRLTVTGNAEAGGIPWQPVWMLPMDLILTGINTFVLICSSVTMVKALAAIQDGNVKKLRIYLLCTMLGGSLFVGFQCYEWTHFIHEGITAQGLVVPDLNTAMKRAETLGSKATKLEIAQQLYGLRDLKAAAGGTTERDFGAGKFEEVDYLALPLLLKTDIPGDDRPIQRGAVHDATYGVPATRAKPGMNAKDLIAQLEKDATDGPARMEVLKQHREQRARVASGFSSTFYVMTGFHGLHVFIGVIYLGVILFRSFKGAYTASKNSPVEIVGLYWHFVDLVWVLLFMLIYLIV